MSQTILEREAVAPSHILPPWALRHFASSRLHWIFGPSIVSNAKFSADAREPAYKRMLKISWIDHRSNQFILEELDKMHVVCLVYNTKKKLKYLVT